MRSAKILKFSDARIILDLSWCYLEISVAVFFFTAFWRVRLLLFFLPTIMFTIMWLERKVLISFSKFLASSIFLSLCSLSCSLSYERHDESQFFSVSFWWVRLIYVHFSRMVFRWNAARVDVVDLGEFHSIYCICWPQYVVLMDLNILYWWISIMEVLEFFSLEYAFRWISRNCIDESPICFRWNGSSRWLDDVHSIYCTSSTSKYWPRNHNTIHRAN